MEDKLDTPDIGLIETFTCVTCGQETTTPQIDHTDGRRDTGCVRIAICSHCGEAMSNDQLKGGVFKLMSAKEFCTLSYDQAMATANTIQRYTHTATCERCGESMIKNSEMQICHECWIEEQNENR